MKILCPCGEHIPDRTDFLPYKASFVADQDKEDLFDAQTGAIRKAIDHLLAHPWHSSTTEAVIVELETALRDLVSESKRIMYQCPSCGRLFLWDRTLNKHHIFIPASDTVPATMLQSVKGVRWKRFLFGVWNSGERSGTIDGATADQKHKEFFDSWGELRDRYWGLFTKLKKEEVLRGAILKRDYDEIHEWPID